MNIKAIIKTVLTKLQFIDAVDQELDLEALMLWVFLLITAFRAFFAGVNLTITHGISIKWIIPDINLAATLPMLYSLLSNSHRRYLNSKGASNGQPDSTTTTPGVTTTTIAGTSSNCANDITK